jgi:hypothetical protein
VYELGAVELFTPMGQRLATSFQLPLAGPGATGRCEELLHVSVGAEGFAACSFTADGMARLHIVPDLVHPLLITAHNTGLNPGSRPPVCLCVVDGAFTDSGLLEVLVATAEGSILHVAPQPAAPSGGARGGGIGIVYSGQDRQLEKTLGTVVLLMSLSPFGNALSCFCENGEIVVLDARDPLLQTVLLRHQAGRDSVASQLHWCGEDYVAVLWREPYESVLVLMDIAENKKEIPYPDTVYAVSEIDGLRVYTEYSHELYRRVPTPEAHACGMNELLASVTLCSAVRKFEESDPECDRLINELQNDGTLGTAVSECVAAALHVWSFDQQQRLLRAAAYGKAFDLDGATAPLHAGSYEPKHDDAPVDLPALLLLLEDSDGHGDAAGTAGAADAASPSYASAFLAACRRLKVLNSLRDTAVGMPLTCTQFAALSTSVVVDRLCKRRQYKLALQLCHYLGVQGKAAGVLLQWANEKVRFSPHMSDEELLASVSRRLAGVPGVPFADVAAAADSAGRRRVATRLLSYAPRTADQVSILLKMGESRLALERALECGDYDLISLALAHMRREASQGTLGASPAHRAAAQEAQQQRQQKQRKGPLSASALFGGGASTPYDASVAQNSPYLGPMSMAGPPAFPGADGEDGGLGGGPLLGLPAGAGRPSLQEQERAFFSAVLEFPAAINMLAAVRKERLNVFGSGNDGYDASGTSGGPALTPDGAAPGANGDLTDGLTTTALARLFGSAGRPLDAGLLWVQEATRQAVGSEPTRVQHLKRASDAFRTGERLGEGSPYASEPAIVAERNECAFQRQAAEEEEALLNAQAALQRDLGQTHPAIFGRDFIGKTMRETLVLLMRASEMKRCQLVRDTFKVPDTLFWSARIEVLAAAQDWKGLYAFATEKASPVGYAPFAQMCIARNAPITETLKYIAKVPGYEEKMTMLMTIKAYTDAVELAAKKQDVDRLEEIAALQDLTPSAEEALKRAFHQLQGRR